MIAAGTRIGSYEILSPLGAGGMGEVWRARDARLGREVAIKVLPDSVAEDTERLARFVREAQLLAALNHPHIAAIYGVEKSGGIDALILELVEGETLEGRIAAGPIPPDEAVAIARQIADALAAAHERGIVHRDLKPANVKLTPGGQIKVLDFGLAKAVSGDGSSPNVTSSPTVTAQTQTGVILGTAAYMSPEQARGKAVDKRADIWAFGALLYEMLTARRPFVGETVSDTLAAVLKTDPDWTALPAETPGNVRRVLRRCLERDRERRFHDIADARLELEETPEIPSPPAPSAASRRSQPGVLWGFSLLLAVIAGLGWLALRPKPAAPRPHTAFAVGVSAADQIPFDDTPVLDLSRDGRELVFISERSGSRRLMLRSLDNIEPRPIAGTEGAFSPFFSPDGNWIGFFADGKLKKVPASGGVSFVLADAPNNRGGVWLTDDSIVYTPDFTTGLRRIPASGGQPEVLTTPDAKNGERTHRWPAYLPGGTSVLFTIGTLKNPGSYDDARIAIYDSGARKSHVVLSNGSMARWSPPGHLVYVRSQTLLAAPFDSATGKLTGESHALTDRPGGDASSGVVYAATAVDGSFAFVPGAHGPVDGGLVLVDRAGRAKSLPLPPHEYHGPRFSPDGKRLALTIGPGHGHGDEIWTCDVETGALTRLTFGDDNGNYYPVWSPDARRLAYSSDRGHQGIYFKNSDGSGDETPLHPQARPDLPSDWSRDGSMLAITRNFPAGSALTVSLRGGKEAPSENAEENAAATPVFSPDGRWIAYTALASAGSPAQVIVKPLSGQGGKIQITSDGGAFPVWTDREIIFMSESKVIAIEAQTQPVFRAGARRELFESAYDRSEMPLRDFDVTRDGKTFVFITGGSGRARKQVNVVLGWSDELARAAPAKK
jgi:serine/threonine-protein kinase